MFVTNRISPSNTETELKCIKLEIDEKTIRRYQHFKVFAALVANVFKKDDSPASLTHNKSIIFLKSKEHVRELLFLSILLENKSLEVLNSGSYAWKQTAENKVYFESAKKLIHLQLDEKNYEEEVAKKAMYLQLNDPTHYEEIASKINIVFLRKPLKNEKSIISQWFPEGNYPFDLENKCKELTRKLTSPSPELRDEKLCNLFKESFSVEHYERLCFVMGKEDINYTIKQIVYNFFIWNWHLEKTNKIKPSPTITPKREKPDQAKKVKKGFFSRFSFEIPFNEKKASDKTRRLAEEILRIGDLFPEDSLELCNYLRKAWGLHVLTKSRRDLEKERERLQEKIEDELKLASSKETPVDSKYDREFLKAMHASITNLDKWTTIERPRSKSLEIYEFDDLFLKPLDKKILLKIIDDFTIACAEQFIKVDFNDLVKVDLPRDNPISILATYFDWTTFFFEELILRAPSIEYIPIIAQNILKMIKLSKKHDSSIKIRANFMLNFALILVFSQASIKKLLPYLNLNEAFLEKIKEEESLFDHAKNYLNYRNYVASEFKPDEPYIPLLSVIQREFINKKEVVQLKPYAKETSQEAKNSDQYKITLEEGATKFILFQSSFPHSFPQSSTNFMHNLMKREFYELPHPVDLFIPRQEDQDRIKGTLSLSQNGSFGSFSSESIPILKRPKLPKSFSLDSADSEDSDSNDEAPREALTLKEWVEQCNEIKWELSERILESLKNQINAIST